MKITTCTAMVLAMFAAPLAACGDAPLPGTGVDASSTVDAGKDSGPVDASIEKDASTTDAATSDAGPIDGSSGDGQADAAAPCTTRTYANFGEAWFQSRCNSCHASSTTRLTSQALIRQHLDACKTAIGAGTMPLPPTTLPAAEKTVALQWLNCGAP